jgi:hypothetical protein
VAFFGSVSSNTPSVYLAWAVASSTSWPSENALDLAVTALGAKHRVAVLDVLFVLQLRGYRNFVAVN